MGAAADLGDRDDLRTRPHRRRNIELRARVADLNASVQRSDATAQSARSAPRRLGERPPEDGSRRRACRPRPAPGPNRAAFLAFGRWLMRALGRGARPRDHRAAREGRAFGLTAETNTGVPLEVQGRKTASHVIVRFTSLSESLRVQARLRLENQRLAADYDIMIGLLDALKMRVLAAFRRRAAEMEWNRAYAEAVESPSGGDAARATTRNSWARSAARSIARASPEEPRLRPDGLDRRGRRPPCLRGHRLFRRRGLGWSRL